MHSGEVELMTLTYARLEDNLIRHRGDRDAINHPVICAIGYHTQLAKMSFDEIFHLTAGV